MCGPVDRLERIAIRGGSAGLPRHADRDRRTTAFIPACATVNSVCELQCWFERLIRIAIANACCISYRSPGLLVGILAQPRSGRSPMIRGPISARGCAGWVKGALSSSSARHPRYVSGAIQGVRPSPLALPAHVMDDWRLGEEVICNCLEVAV